LLGGPSGRERSSGAEMESVDDNLAMRELHLSPSLGAGPSGTRAKWRASRACRRLSMRERERDSARRLERQLRPLEASWCPSGEAAILEIFWNLFCFCFRFFGKIYRSPAAHKLPGGCQSAGRQPLELGRLPNRKRKWRPASKGPPTLVATSALMRAHYIVWPPFHWGEQTAPFLPGPQSSRQAARPTDSRRRATRGELREAPPKLNSGPSSSAAFGPLL